MSGGYVPAADARIAASLLLLRDGAHGPEVLMLRRADRAGDPRSGAAVFPGGVVDAMDGHSHGACIGADEAAWSRRLGLARGGIDYAIAALRECFEEVGLLIACGRDGQALDLAGAQAAMHSWRDRLNRSEISIAAFCAAFDLQLDLRGLAYHSHWLTPPGSPKRFDTRFFCALAPPGQIATADEGEAVELMWLTPAAALDPAGGLKLLPVTRRTLEELTRFESAIDAWQASAQQREIPLVMPRRAAGRNGPRVVLPGDFAYAEVGRLDPEGRGDVSSDIVPGTPVRLSPRVLRLTAPNPGMMTGPGTNTYIVNDGGGSPCTVIDPGPAMDEHVQALIAHAPGPIERILVTHTHKDHSPAAQLLHQATGAPVLGRRADHPMWQDESFAPQQLLAGGERIVIGPGTTLAVLHTPGHASNHLCYMLEEERTLFTGDHVMQGSTVVINPPDGEMAAYLRSLGELTRLQIDWLAPGHGFLLADPRAVLRALIVHRRAREAKVLAALRAEPELIDALLPRVYADVPAALHPMARRSLLAHLLKLQQDGVAGSTGELWRRLPAAVDQ